MSIYFADTSAIIKHYVTETGSMWVQGWADRSAGNIVIISRLATVEVVAGLSRRQREKSITAADFVKLQGVFINDASQFYLVIDLEVGVLAQARYLVTKHPIRTLDAIQLASAIQARRIFGSSFYFVSADQRLLAAASGEGFPVDDPNAHP